jgi:hypothetical protein
MRPESFAGSMLELHTKKRTREAIKCERRMRKSLELDTDAMWEPYSSCHDKAKYNNQLPLGSYLSIAHNKHHMLLEPYMTLECKERCGDIYSMDVQYKEAKHLCRYHGKHLLMGTVTVMNEYKEIRTQFHVVSDNHVQYERPLSAMLETIQAWGQKMPWYCYTDNPTKDRHFLQSKIPSLKREQERLDQLVRSSCNAARADQHKTTEYASKNCSQCQFISCYEDISKVCDLFEMPSSKRNCGMLDWIVNGVSFTMQVD